MPTPKIIRSNTAFQVVLKPTVKRSTGPTTSVKPAPKRGK
jgi:hypothetical protein